MSPGSVGSSVTGGGTTVCSSVTRSVMVSVWVGTVTESSSRFIEYTAQPSSARAATRAMTRARIQEPPRFPDRLLVLGAGPMLDSSVTCASGALPSPVDGCPASDGGTGMTPAAGSGGS